MTDRCTLSRFRESHYSRFTLIAMDQEAGLELILALNNATGLEN